MKKILVLLIVSSFILFYVLVIDRHDVYDSTEYKSRVLADYSLKLGRKFTVISINANAGSIYFFHLPIVAISWRHVGYEPIFVIIYSEGLEFDELDKLTIQYLNNLNVKVLYVETKPGYDITTAMIIREMIGIIPDQYIKDNDFVITTDSDLYSIDPKYYEYKENYITIWNGYCCGKFEYNGKEYRVFPMGKFVFLFRPDLH